MPSDRYTKKPVTVEAIQYTGANLREVLDFTGKHPHWGEWFKSFEDYEAHVHSDRGVFKIMTLEGTMEALPGDWIIRGVKGEHYPCKPDIFAATYTRSDLCASGQQVRALVWDEYAPGCFFGKSECGDYSVAPSASAFHEGEIRLSDVEGNFSYFASPEAAKAAAQADYESRILAALMPAPQPEGQDALKISQEYQALFDEVKQRAQPEGQAQRLSEAIRQACDLMAERSYGSPARSPAHNARLVLEAALAHATPTAQEAVPVACLHGYCDAENCPACSQDVQDVAQEAVPTCFACEDNPKRPNIPCAVCGAHPPRSSETVPVAWMKNIDGAKGLSFQSYDEWTPLYTAPPPQPSETVALEDAIAAIMALPLLPSVLSVGFVSRKDVIAALRALKGGE